MIRQLLDASDPTSEYRLSAYKALYLYVIIFITFGIVKPDYTVFWLALPVLGLLNYDNPANDTFAKKDLNVLLMFVLGAFCVYAMNILWNQSFYFYIFVGTYFGVLTFYAITKNPPFFMVVTQSLMFGLVSVYNYSSNYTILNDYINQMLDILCVGIITFWALKLYQNDADKVWLGIYVEFFEQLSKRVSSNADNYIVCAELRNKAHKLHRFLLKKNGYLNFIRFYSESYKYQSTIERIRENGASKAEIDQIVSNINSLKNAIKNRTKCRLDNNQSDVSNDLHKERFNNLVLLWNRIC